MHGLEDKRPIKKLKKPILLYPEVPEVSCLNPDLRKTPNPDFAFCPLGVIDPPKPILFGVRFPIFPANFCPAGVKPPRPILGLLTNLGTTGLAPATSFLLAVLFPLAILSTILR